MEYRLIVDRLYYTKYEKYLDVPAYNLITSRSIGNQMRKIKIYESYKTNYRIEQLIQE